MEDGHSVREEELDGQTHSNKEGMEVPGEWETYLARGNKAISY